MKTQLHKRLIFFIAVIFFCTISNYSFASHNAGGELSYEFIGASQYHVKFTMYRDCFGIPAPTSVMLYIESASCSQSFTQTMTLVAGTGQEITHPCSTQQSTCNGGTSPGIQKWEYETVVLIPALCPDWIFYISDCCRNQAITTIASAAGMGVYIEARLNNMNGDNTSPQFYIDPELFLCIGQDLYLNNGIVDPDGDSIVYNMIAPRSDANTACTYNPGYSVVQPLSSASQITLDPVTGDFFIHPTAVECGVVVFQMTEYRNGNIIGSVMRDIQLYTVSCNNQVPSITGINGTPLHTAYVLAQQPFFFNVFCFDGDSNDSLTMVSDSGIAGALFTIQGNLRPTGVFSWTPTLADVSAQPHVLTITVFDQYCPTQGVAVSYFSIYVTTDSTLVTPLFSSGYFTGNVYYDANSDGLRDSSEVSVPSQSINIQPDNLGIYSNNLGDYLFYSMTNGTHVININPTYGWVVTSDSLTYTVTNDSINQSGFDFGINSPNPENDLNISIGAGTPRCNAPTLYQLTYENMGSTMLNGRVIFIIDDSTTFNSSFPSPDLISGDSLFFNFTNLWPFNNNHISVILLLPGPGDTINFEAIAQFDSSGIFVTSSTQSLQQIVTCSFDPNDKLVLPEGLYSDHRTLYNEELQYTIRFQNTGTDTAFLVFIHDFIDPSLDLSTLHVCGSSHPVTTTTFQNRMVEFNFQDIQLPDSNVDELASHGFVQYRIRPMTNLLLPVVVNNSANIFFDSNFPVETNNVWNTLMSDLSVDVVSVQGTNETINVIPNPFSNNTRIVFSKSFINTPVNFVLMDAMGRIVDKKNVNGSDMIFSKGKLNPGIYFFELTNETGNRATGKLIME